MENKKNIHESLVSIMIEIEPIKKEKRNSQQGFMYRGIDDIMNELHSLFAKHHVIISPECIERIVSERQSKGGGLLFYISERIKFTFWAEDGSSIFSIIDGEAMDSGDKATNKAMSVALKYCLMQMFLIPTDEMKDPDATSHEVRSSDNKDDGMSEIAIKLSIAMTELKDCKDIPDLQRIWGKYKDLQNIETFRLAKDNMKKNIDKNYK
jgi:hypothetical protein